MALGQFAAVGPMNHRDMGEIGLRPTHGIVKLDLAKGVGQMVVAADDLGNAHVVIVDNDGVHIGGRTVAAQKNHVVELLVGDPDLALHLVLQQRLPGLRRL